MTVVGGWCICREKGFDVKWVDDTHAIGIFSSAIAGMHLPLTHVGSLVNSCAIYLKCFIVFFTSIFTCFALQSGLIDALWRSCCCCCCSATLSGYCHTEMMLLFRPLQNTWLIDRLTDWPTDRPIDGLVCLHYCMPDGVSAAAVASYVPTCSG